LLVRVHRTKSLNRCDDRRTRFNCTGYRANARFAKGKPCSICRHVHSITFCRVFRVDRIDFGGRPRRHSHQTNCTRLAAAVAYFTIKNKLTLNDSFGFPTGIHIPTVTYVWFPFRNRCSRGSYRAYRHRFFFFSITCRFRIFVIVLAVQMLDRPYVIEYSYIRQICVLRDSQDRQSI